MLTHEEWVNGAWYKEAKIAIEQTSGRQTLNIHGTIELETGRTVMLETMIVDANSTIRLFEALQRAYPDKRRIHVFLDNARYHVAGAVQDWLKTAGRRIKMHTLPVYCPHLNPSERLWGVMHKHITHNRDHPTIRDFASAVLGFLRTEVTRKWNVFRDYVSDNFRVIRPEEFRVIK